MSGSPSSTNHLASSLIKTTILLVLVLALAMKIVAIPRCSITGFGPGRNFSVASTNSVPATGDFNGDGNLDLVAASILLNGSVVVMLNDGTGNFVSGTTYPTESAHFDVQIADFNQDNRLDIVVSNYFANSISVLLGNGDGTFNPAINSPSGGPRPQRMVISDFNHDGHFDVAVANAPIEGQGNISVLMGNGTGYFTVTTPIMPHTQFLRGADFNRDGNMDLLGVTTLPLSLYLGNAQGGFFEPIPVGTNLPTGVPSFAIDDFNRDQIPDIAAIIGNSNLQVVILRGNGDGTFVTAESYPVGMQNGAHLVTGDVNGDGEVDIVGAASETLTGRGFVMFGTGSGTYNGWVNYYIDGLNPSQLTVADLNGDGRADIVTDMNNAPSISMVLSTCLNPSPRYDFDGDGKSEIAVYRPSSGVWYAQRTTDGTLLSLPWGISTDSIVPGDYDGDSETDVAVYRPSIGAWFVLRTTNSTFIAQSWGISTDIPVPADYDADGRTDFAVFRSGAWYVLKSSDGSITSQFFGFASDKPMPADYDGDGRADIAVYRPSDRTWYIRQSSDNAFRAQSFGASGDLPVSGDFDGDGKADLAVYRPSTGTWYAERSSNSSLQVQYWGVVSDTPVPADYDGDGKTDHAVYRPSDGVWYVLNSVDTSVVAQPFGLSTDVPLPSASFTP